MKICQPQIDEIFQTQLPFETEAANKYPNCYNFADDICKVFYLNQRVLIALQIKLKFGCTGPFDNKSAIV